MRLECTRSDQLKQLHVMPRLSTVHPPIIPLIIYSKKHLTGTFDF